MQEITPESIAALLEKIRQTPSIRQIEYEAGLYNAQLSRIADGSVVLTDEIKRKLQPVLVKYNF